MIFMKITVDHLQSHGNQANNLQCIKYFVEWPEDLFGCSICITWPSPHISVNLVTLSFAVLNENTVRIATSTRIVLLVIMFCSK